MGSFSKAAMGRPNGKKAGSAENVLMGPGLGGKTSGGRKAEVGTGGNGGRKSSGMGTVPKVMKGRHDGTGPKTAIASKVTAMKSPAMMGKRLKTSMMERSGMSRSIGKANKMVGMAKGQMAKAKPNKTRK